MIQWFWERNTLFSIPPPSEDDQAGPGFQGKIFSPFNICVLFLSENYTFQTMSVDSSESASASEGVYDDLEYLNLIFQVFQLTR